MDQEEFQRNVFKKGNYRDLIKFAAGECIGQEKELRYAWADAYTVELSGGGNVADYPIVFSRVTKENQTVGFVHRSYHVLNTLFYCNTDILKGFLDGRYSGDMDITFSDPWIKRMDAETLMEMADFDEYAAKCEDARKPEIEFGKTARVIVGEGEDSNLYELTTKLIVQRVLDNTWGFPECFYVKRIEVTCKNASGKEDYEKQAGVMGHELRTLTNLGIGLHFRRCETSVDEKTGDITFEEEGYLESYPRMAKL